MKKIPCRLAVASLLSALALPAEAGVFLRIDPIRGDSTDARHKGEIDLSSVQFGANRNVQTLRVCPSEVVLTKSTDSSSAPLIAATMTGSVFPKATITFSRSGEPAIDYLTIELTNVVVLGYNTSSGGDLPTEAISLGYQSAIYRYTPLDPRGGLGVPVTANITRGSC